MDAISDGSTTVVAGIMEHIEAAGVHSGDSACIVPPRTLTEEVIAKVEAWTIQLAEAIGVKGLLNVQYVVKDGHVKVIEANPRASRTIPYLSKAIGHPLAKYAALIAAGKTLEEIGFTKPPKPEVYAVKEVVLPFEKFRGVIPVLGPEMRSTGESMGIDVDPDAAFFKAQLGAGTKLPSHGKVLCLGTGSELEQEVAACGFDVVHDWDEAEDSEGPALVIDLTASMTLRRAMQQGVPYVTTAEAASWSVRAAAYHRDHESIQITALQDLRFS